MDEILPRVPVRQWVLSLPYRLRYLLGYDDPSADCVIVARPTRSRLLYIQQIGRVSRLYPGKENGLVIDLVGATERHDLLTLSTVLALRPRTLAKHGAIAALQEREATEAREAAKGQLVAERVDLFRDHPPLPREGFHWVTASGGRFALSVASATLILSPGAGEHWRVLLRERAGTRVLADGLPLEYAQGSAEDYARKVGAGVLVTAGAPWRSEPATERQLALLHRWRIPVPTGLTKGRAADLITASVAGRP